MRNYLIIIFLLGILSSCDNQVSIQNFDAAAWKSDPLGCQGIRKNLLESLEKGKNQLKSKNPNQILSLLGSPDKQELYDRNQRYYIYFYDKGTQCQKNAEPDLSQSPIIRIRFSAIDIVTEVVIQ